jgi:hypothetical protein
MTEHRTHSLAHRTDRIIVRAIGIAVIIYLLAGLILGALVLTGAATGKPAHIVPTFQQPDKTCPDTGSGITVPNPDTGLCPGD